MVDLLTVIFTSIPWAIIVGLLIYFLKNPEKAEKWYSIIARSLSFLSMRLEKSGVARDIQADLNSFAKNLSPQDKESMLPYGVKIKWVSIMSREAFVKKGKVIIKMDYHKNQAKNFLYATLEWVNRGLIPEARHLLDKTVLRAVDLVFVNSLLAMKKRHDVRQLFLDEIYELEVTKGSALERHCNTFDRLNRRGLFAGIALKEFASLGKKIGSAIPEAKVRHETVDFMNMLEKLSRKLHGQDVSPNYCGENIKCSVVLIARQETYLLYGLDPYLNWMNQCCEKGINSFYVCGIGDPNIMIVKKIRDAYEQSKKVFVVSENLYPLKDNRAIVLHMEKFT